MGKKIVFLFAMVFSLAFSGIAYAAEEEKTQIEETETLPELVRIIQSQEEKSEKALTENPVETVTETSTETKTETSAETSAETSVKTPIEKSVETEAFEEVQTENPVETPVEETVKTPAKESVETSTEITDGAVAETEKQEVMTEEELAKNYIPVLMYHHFKDDNDIPPGDGLLTSKDALEEQIQYFLKEGYQIISLERLEYLLNHSARNVSLTGKELKLDRKYLCITMDDGYYSNYEIAFPLFQKYHVPASVFAITDFVTQQYGVKKFTWSQAWDMDRRGWLRVYSHTPDHVPVEENNEMEFLQGMRKSRDTLKEELKKDYRVKAMSYPNGRYTDESRRLLTEEGYAMQFTIENGVVTRETPRDAMPRITVESGMTGEDIVRKIEQTAMETFAVESEGNAI